ncbi:hypothetical protein HJ581_0008050 [Rhodococcus opacus]|nr:hypothetical protein HJ581_0008050 [Rhodococcus opacus]
MAYTKVLLSMATAGSVMFAPSFVTAAPALRVEPLLAPKSVGSYSSPSTTTTKVFAVRAHTTVGRNVEQSPEAVVMAKLVTLQRLEPGWDGPGSRGLLPEVESIYRKFVEMLPARLLADAEPIATHDGGIRMEWDRDASSYVAELEASGGMYLCVLGGADEVRDVELDHFDLETLVDFFEKGKVS